MPTVQGTDAFDHGFDVPADYSAVFGTPTAVTTPLYQSRLNSLEINSPGNEGVRKAITGSPSLGWMGFAVRVPSAPPVTGVSFAAIHSVTSNIQARINIGTSGAAYAFIGAGGNESGTTLVADTWYWIEMIYDVTAATHSLYWRVNGVDQLTPTVAATGPDSVDYGQILSVSGGGTLTWHAGGYWAWGSAASTSDWLGEPEFDSDAPFAPLLYGYGAM